VTRATVGSSFKASRVVVVAIIIVVFGRLVSAKT
jgi:hypothetical protein